MTDTEYSRQLNIKKREENARQMNRFANRMDLTNPDHQKGKIGVRVMTNSGRSTFKRQPHP